MKKIFRTLLIFLSIICFSFVFTACGEDPSDKGTTPADTETNQTDTGNGGTSDSGNGGSSDNGNGGSTDNGNGGDNGNTDNGGETEQNVTIAEVNTAFNELGDNFTAELSLTIPEELANILSGFMGMEVPTSMSGLTLKTTGEVVLLSANIPDTFEGEIYIVDGNIYMREKEDGVWGEFADEQPGFVDIISLDNISLDNFDIAKIIEAMESFGITVETTADESSLTVTIKLADKIAEVQDLIKVALNSESTLADIFEDLLKIVNYEYDDETYDRAVDAFVAKLKAYITETTTVGDVIDYVATEFKFNPDLVNALIDLGLSSMNQEEMGMEIPSMYSDFINYSAIEEKEDEEGFDFETMKNAPVLTLLSMYAGVEFSLDPTADNYFGAVIDVAMNFTIENLMTMFAGDGESENNGEVIDNNNEQINDLDEYNEDYVEEDEGLMSKILPIIQMIAGIDVKEFNIGVAITLDDGALNTVELGINVQVELPSESSDSVEPTTNANAVLGFSALATVEFSNIGTTSIDTTAVDAFIEANATETIDQKVVEISVDVTELDYETDYELAVYDENQDEYLVTGLEEIFEEDEAASFVVKGINEFAWDEDLQENYEQEFDAVTVNKEKIVLNGLLVSEIINNYKYSDFNVVTINVSDDLCIVLNIFGEIPEDENQEDDYQDDDQDLDNNQEQE